MSYEVLLYKVNNSQINYNLPNLTESFLCNTSESVALNGQSSNWWSARLSIRILIFFFIYISDLGQEFISDVKLFADDFSCAKAFASALNNDLLKLHN